MKIFIVSGVFHPEPIISARTSYELANELTKIGHEVTVITSFPSRPAGKLYQGYKRKIFLKEKFDENLTLIRCFSFFSRNSTIISRTLENISFGISSGFYLLFSSKPNAIYSNTWPILSTGIILFIAKLKKIPIIVSIQDIYPESLISQRRFSKKNLLYKLLLFMDLQIVNRTNKVVVISKYFFEIYKNIRKIDPKKIEFIPNWIDENLIKLVPKEVLRNELQIPCDAFVVLFGGNIGRASGMTEFLKNIKNFKTSNKFVYLIIAGSGSELEKCKILSSQVKGLKIIFISPWESEDTSKVLAAADVLLLPTSNLQSLVSVPSKLISYMFSCKPIYALSQNDSEVTKIIQEANCGWVVDPNESDNVIFTFEKIINLPKFELIQKGILSRDYASKNFSKSSVLPKLISLITNLS